MSSRKVFVIVDDDEDDLFFFEQALRKTDNTMHLIKISKSEEALDVLKRVSVVPDYIFLDLNMPKKSGKECLAEIRNEAHLSKVPVIIYTTSSSPSDKKDLFQLGANHFVTKFSDFGQLCKMLSDLLANQYKLDAPFGVAGKL